MTAHAPKSTRETARLSLTAALPLVARQPSALEAATVASQRAEGTVRFAGASAAVLAFAFSASAATLPSPPAVLKSAERLLEAGEFEGAVRKLRALNARQTLSLPTQLQSYYLLGLGYLYLGDGSSARAAYQRLAHLTRGPSQRFTFPLGASPKLKKLFEQARHDTEGSTRVPARRALSLPVSHLHFPRIPRYWGPNPVVRREVPEREATSRPAVSNIAGWTHWIEPAARVP